MFKLHETNPSQPGFRSAHFPTVQRKETRDRESVGSMVGRQGSTDGFDKRREGSERERERGRTFLFLPFWFTVERTTNKWPGTCTRATSTRIGKRILRSECRFRESFVNRALAGPGCPLLGRGDTLIDHHLLSSLYPLFFSRFFPFSLFIPHLDFDAFLHPSIHSSTHPPPPFFPLPVRSIGRVSRLKRHLLIVATSLLSFLSSSPFFFAFPFRVPYTYVRTRCSNWKLIFESIGER